MAADQPDFVDDPCGFANWLRPQLATIATGGAVVDIRHGDERVAYGPGSYPDALRLYNNARAACARKNGTCTGRRRAFIAR